jgi:hypothetical protein
MKPEGISASEQNMQIIVAAPYNLGKASTAK